MKYFTRYFVKDGTDEIQEIYDGDDDQHQWLALEAAKTYEGGYVDALDYVSDGQCRRVVTPEVS